MISQQKDRILGTAILTLLLLVVVFASLATGATRRQDFLVVEALTGIALVLWTLRLVFSPHHQFQWPWICWIVLAGVGYAFIRTVTADLPYIAQQEFMRILVYAGVFLLAINNARESETLDRFVNILAVLGTLIAAYAIYQYVTGSQKVWTFTRPPNYEGRASGTFICPNNLAGFLNLILPLVLSLTIGGKTNVVRQVFLGYASLVMMLGLATTLSRGGWIICGIAILCLVAIHLRQKQHVRGALVLLSLVICLTAAVATQSWAARRRMTDLVKNQAVLDASATMRWSMWKSATLMWQDHFWWGVGPGHFDYRFPNYRLPEVQARPGYAHNDYLNTLADWGVTGFILLAGLVGATLLRGRTLLRLTRRRRNDLSDSGSSRWSFVAGTITAIVGALSYALIDFNLQIPANAVLTTLMVGMLFTLSAPSARRRHRRKAQFYAQLLLAGCATTVGLTLFSRIPAMARETHHLDIVDGEQSHTEARMLALHSAFEIRPDNFETSYTLGEAHRQIGLQGNPGYEEHVRQAIDWFRRTRQLNPYDPYPLAHIGICLDWLGQPEAALPHYQQALQLDPNNHHLPVLMGWHFVQTGELMQARHWFLHSLNIQFWPNPLAWKNLQRVNNLMRQQTAQQP